MAQEDRLSSLGRLVASVCHEINNPITSIVTFNKLVRNILQSKASDLPDAEMSNVARYLDLSFREAMRCGSIVKSLLTFARPKSLEAKSIIISELVDTILLLTEHQLELANIRCEVHFPSGPFTACGDHAQIQQCLLNLIFNAIDAMPNGGTLTISGEIDRERRPHLPGGHRHRVWDRASRPAADFRTLLLHQNRWERQRPRIGNGLRHHTRTQW